MASSTMPDDRSLRLVPLGGLGEFGLNSLALEWEGHAILIDAGVLFATSDMPGIDSVVPGSRCPRCGADIRWHDNVPVFSWLVLGGRCRDCGAGISVRYPVVEALSGGLWAVAGAYLRLMN